MSCGGPSPRDTAIPIKKRTEGDDVADVKDQVMMKRYLRQWGKAHVGADGAFELTPRCTLDCKMCYVHLTREQMGDRRELTTEEWISILDQAVENGLLYALLTGGECMLHEGFKEIFLHLLNSGVVTSINTNGLLLTDDMLEFFRVHRPNFVRVTLYGASEDGYERCTGRRAYRQITENIDKLISIGISPYIALTLTKYCADETVEMLRFARERNLQISLDVAMMQPEEGTGRDDSYVLSPEEVVDTFSKIRRFYGTPFYDNPPVESLPARREDAVPVYGLRCNGGRFLYVVRWDGMMQSCFNAGGSYDVRKLGLKACWDALLEDRAQQLQPFECEQCPLRSVCVSCYLYRRDPKDPMHCNPRTCAITVAKYNAGITTLKPHEKTEEPASSMEDC